MSIGIAGVVFDREISSPEEGSQKVVDKVGDLIRFYSIIVGESKSVRVGPLSSSFLQARDWRDGLVTECVAGRLSSRFTGNRATSQTMVRVTTGGECVDTVCRFQTTTSRGSVRKTAETGPRLN